MAKTANEMQALKELYHLYYDKFYANPSKYGDDVYAYSLTFDDLYENNPVFKSIADRFIEYRGDLLTSDRECAAFYKAVNHARANA